MNGMDRMKRYTPPYGPALSSDRGGVERQTRLSGWRLMAARVSWILLVAWMLATFVWSLPTQLIAFQHPTPRSTELGPSVIAALHQVGISLDRYAWVAVGFGSLIMLISVSLALVLFWR